MSPEPVIPFAKKRKNRLLYWSDARSESENIRVDRLAKDTILSTLKSHFQPSESL
jgi:hypothetical protein